MNWTYYTDTRGYRLRMLRAYRAFMRCKYVTDRERDQAREMITLNQEGLVWLRHQYYAE